MSISVQRNEIVQLDAFESGDRRNTFKPLIQQLGEDLLANGFTNVGPQITRISIKDSELTKYIDEFIVFNYDNNLGTAGDGASGLDDPASPTSGANFTNFLIDGPFSKRIKAVDDFYKSATWADGFATLHNKPQTAPQGIDYTKLVGPNAELFSFLCPHPDMRGGEAIWKTRVFVRTAVTTSTTISLQNTEMLSVGETLLENNNSAVSGGPTITSIISETSIELSSAITTVADSSLKFGDPNATLDRPDDLLTGHFYKKIPPLVPLQTGEGTQPGYVGLPALAQKIYANEKEKIKRLITNPARSVTFLPATATGVNTKAKLRHYKEELMADGTIMHHFWISNFKDQFFFPSGTVEPSKFRGEMMIGFISGFSENEFQTGDTYKFTFTHNPVAPAPGINVEVDVVVSQDASVEGFTKSAFDMFVKTNIGDPKGGLYKLTLDPDRQGVIEFESREIGHNLSCALTRTERTTSSFNNTLTKFVVEQTSASSTVTGSTTAITGNSYTNGYVHEIQLRGIEGANIDDTFTITLSGLIDQTDVTQTQNITITHQALTQLNSSQLAEEIAIKMRANPYIRDNMVVTPGANFLTIKYGRNSKAYMRKGEVGATHGLLNTATTSGVGGTIGASSSSEYALNGFLVADLPATAQFDFDASAVSAFYTADTLIGNTDPMDFSLSTLASGATTTVDKVRVEFPLSRDLGTFANPVNGTYVAFSGYDETAGKTNYSVSYFQQVLTDSTRPLGPQVSFDAAASQTHPNVTHGGAARGLTEFGKFNTFTNELTIESFEYITDMSMGPLIFETAATDPICGNNGDQPWRMRFDVSRGVEVRETSPYVNAASLELTQSVGTTSASNFEYLNVHVATEFQLQSDGEIADTLGRDGVDIGTIREPGHLGSLRPQFNGYLESLAHLVNPFTNRTELEQSITSGFNIAAGVVGSNHYDETRTKKGSQNSQVGDVFTNGTSIVDPAYPSGVDTPSTYTIAEGVLNDNEYRYEEQYLVGSSTELVADTPFNSGRLRLQKGLFRRTGKSHPDIALQYPMQYTLTKADHGIAFYIRDQASVDSSDDHAFFVVQRHIDATTGVADYTSDQQPVHCLYQSSEAPVLFSDFTPYFTEKTTERTKSLAFQGIFDNAGNYIYEFRIDELKDKELEALEMDIQGRFRRFCVREKDVLKPWDRHVFAGINERDSHAVINPLEQLSLNDQGQLVIQFPNRLGTQRFLYTGTELDLISFCSAGAVGQDTLISSDRFSTTGTTDKRRLYKGMMSTEAYGNGMRILQLVGGHGIASTDVDTSQLTS